MNLQIYNKVNARYQKLKLSSYNLEHCYIKFEYFGHSFLSGNKFRKLEYFLKDAKEKKRNALLSFGGAHSNHLMALSQAGKMCGLKTIGYIRGMEYQNQIDEIPTLRKCQENGMTLFFITRIDYRKKHTDAFKNALTKKHDNVYIIEEGGCSQLGVRGCEKILTDYDKQFDYICCPMGTGTTFVGIANTLGKRQKAIGFSALKNSKASSLAFPFIKPDQKVKLSFCYDKHFGGFAKINNELVDFINDFKEKTNILLDPIYNAKLMFYFLKFIKSKYISPSKKILILNTGGEQGIAGMNTYLSKKQMKTIVL